MRVASPHSGECGYRQLAKDLRNGHLAGDPRPGLVPAERPGEKKTITIPVKGDNKKEANETFYLDLFGNSSNSLFTKNRGLGTILNDD